MEKFLLEYGIKWVGSQTKVDKKKMDQLVKDAGPSKLKFNYHLPKEIQLDVRIFENLRSLPAGLKN